MYTKVSDKWLEIQKQPILPEAYIRLTYRATDPDVQQDITAIGKSEEYYSDIQSTVDDEIKNVVRYETLEHNMWVLDNTTEFISKEWDEQGYISNIESDEYCKFETPITLVYECSEVHHNLIKGLTINWGSAYNEYPINYKITVLNGSKVIATKEVNNNNSVLNKLLIDFVDFDNIIVEIIDWCLPNHRARLDSFVVGIDTTYTKDDLTSYSHEMSLDLLSGALPTNSISFTLDNTNNIWNPLNVEGAEKYLLERQEIKAEYGYKIGNNIEYIKGGTFYMNSWGTPSNGIEANFKAGNILEFMSDKYTGVKSGTLYDITLAALTQSNISSSKWIISEQLKNYETSIADDNNNLCSEIIQMCANAGECIIYQNRDGILCITPRNQSLQNYNIPLDVAYSFPEFTTSKELKSVNVNDGMGYYENSINGEIQTLSNTLIVKSDNANEVAKWTSDVLKYRNTINGEFRSDPRLDVGDLISIQSKFGDNHAVCITKLKYDYNGTFKGTYTGRVFEFRPVPYCYSNELQLGE